MNPILIIGGGITGTAAAHRLASRGRAVRLLERDTLAAMASGWTLGGVRQSGRDPAELPLARAAVARWPGLAEALGHETGYHQHGNLRFARTAEEVERIRQMVAEQHALGLDLRFLPDRAAVEAIAPAIGDGVLAASFCPGDGYADPVKTTLAFAKAAAALGAEIREHCRVERIVARGGAVLGVETAEGFIAAERVIVAAGTHSAALLAALGLHLPLRIMQVQVALSTPQAPVFAPVFGVANADCAGRQQPDGRFRFTSGIDTYPGDPEHWTAQSLKPAESDIALLQRRLAPILPAASRAPIERCWGGLIDMTPDSLPVLDASSPVRGLVIAAGFSGHGFGIGPITGEIAGDLACDDAPAHEISAFRLSRFPANAQFAPLTLHG